MCCAPSLIRNKYHLSFCRMESEFGVDYMNLLENIDYLLFNYLLNVECLSLYRKKPKKVKVVSDVSEFLMILLRCLVAPS